jgi:hypothetical protein
MMARFVLLVAAGLGYAAAECSKAPAYGSKPVVRLQAWGGQRFGGRLLLSHKVVERLFRSARSSFHPFGF